MLSVPRFGVRALAPLILGGKQGRNRSASCTARRRAPHPAGTDRCGCPVVPARSCSTHGVCRPHALVNQQSHRGRSVTPGRLTRILRKTPGLVNPNKLPMHEMPSDRRAGPIGRGARAVLGGLFLWALYRFLVYRAEIVHPGNLALYFWALIGIHSHALGSLIPPLRATRRRWGILGGAVAGAVILDLLHNGHWWGMFLPALLYGLAIGAQGILGIELLLTAWLGHAGCESTVWYNLRHRREAPRIDPCPLFDPLDLWERARRARKDR